MSLKIVPTVEEEIREQRRAEEAVAANESNIGTPTAPHGISGNPAATVTSRIDPSRMCATHLFRRHLLKDNIREGIAGDKYFPSHNSPQTRSDERPREANYAHRSG